MKEIIKSGLNSIFKVAEESVKKALNTTSNAVQYNVNQIVKAVKKSVMEMFFILFGLTLIVLGVILFLNRFFALDLILIVAGFIFSYIALLMKVKK